MRVKAKLSIGYPTAMVEDYIDIDDELLEGLSEDHKEEYINQQVDEWAAQYIEAWYEEVDEDDE